MSGALLQLAALGSQDVYLTGNPEITLFKSGYQRHTHFALETIQVSFDGEDLNFGSNNSATVTLERAGDLISKMVLVIKLEACTDSNIEWGYIEKLGHSIINEISITIGQVEIDSFNKEWINIYHELFGNKSHEKNYSKMIGDIPDLKNFNKTHTGYDLFIPIEIWTSKSSSSAFPILALQKQNFQIKVTLNEAIDCINYKGSLEPSSLPTVKSAYLLVDYIFLDSPERKLFLSRDHEYLIEQVQTMSENITSENTRVNLIFDKPCKYLLWTLTLNRYNSRTEFLSWATDNNWDKALDNFAKLIWLSTRNKLNISDITNPVIDLDNTFLNIGESIGMVPSGLEKLEELSTKVKGLFLFAEKNTSTNIYQAKAVIDNVIILENNLTFEDMSLTISELKINFNTSLSTHLTQGTFLDINKVNIIDIYNYGNFINRTDNPIIRSRLLFNGKDKFQERDGNFFNYLNPFYYFNNTPQDGLNTYSFGLKPCDLQPSGTVNFSNLNGKELIISLGKNNIQDLSYINSFFKSGKLNIFTVNYTMLKISPSRDLVGLGY